LETQGPGDTEGVKVGETITTINNLKFTTMKIKLWISVLAVVAISNFAMAQETPVAKQNASVDKNATRPAFVDNNKDGICDNFGVGQAKGNGNGSGRGQGMRYRNGRCCGRGNGRGNGQGRANFVDANNNGICDHRENPVSK
jgi:hypothetical protein